MDSAFILCFLLLGIRLTQALTPDEYISLRKYNQSSHPDVSRPSPVQIFVHQPTNNRNTKIPTKFQHRYPENYQLSSPTERYNQYREGPAAPTKHQTHSKPAYAVAKYDDYYPVRKPNPKPKAPQASPVVKKSKRPARVRSGNSGQTSKHRGRSSSDEGRYQKENTYEISEADKMVNVDESRTVPHQIHSDKKQDERKETKSVSASEQVQQLMHQSEDDKLFVAAPGYGGKTRGQFHEQGMQGPHSYKFGYNTGDSFNPMARYEERDADGIVRGSYSFVDALGKLQVVHYESHPELGFRTKSGHGSYPY